MTFSISVLVQNERHYDKEYVCPKESWSLLRYNSKVCGNPTHIKIRKSNSHNVSEKNIFNLK